jgi:competence protein ComGF
MAVGMMEARDNDYIMNYMILGVLNNFISDENQNFVVDFKVFQEDVQQYLQLLADYEGNIFYSRGFPVVNE